MSQSRARRVGAALLAAMASGAAGAADAPNYQDHVKPILLANCCSCHNPDKAKGGLDLSGYGSIMRGGGSGAAVVPGNAEGSTLYRVLAHLQEPFMPPNAGKRPDPELETIRAWIAGGLLDRAGGQARKDSAAASLALAAAPMEKPAGPPPMPVGLSLEPAGVYERTNAILALACSPWAPLAAVAGERQVALYHTDTLQLLGMLPFPEGQVNALRFSRNGSLLLAAGGVGAASGRAVVWEVATGRRAAAVGEEFDAILAADINPAQTEIAVGGRDRLLKIYVLASGEVEHRIKKHTDWVTAVAFSPDGVLLASGDRNGGLVVWEAANAQEFQVLEGHPAAITALSWRRDGNLLASAGEDGTVRLWDMESGRQVKAWTAHGGGVLGAAFARDGRLATCGRDRKAKLWSADGKELRAFAEFTDLALRVALTHDDARVVAGDWSGQVRVFPADVSEPVGDLAANPPSVPIQIVQAEAILPARRDSAAKRAEAAEKARAEAARLAADAEQRKAAQPQAAQALQAAEGELAAATKARDDAAGALAQAKAAVEAAQARAKALEAAQAQEAKRLADARAAVTAAEGQIPPRQQALAGLKGVLDAARAAEPAALAAAAAAAATAAASATNTDAAVHAAAAQAAAEEAARRRQAVAAAEQALADGEKQAKDAEAALAASRAAAAQFAQTLAKADADLAQGRQGLESAGSQIGAKQTALEAAQAALAAAEKKKADAAAAREAADKAAAEGEKNSAQARERQEQAAAALAVAEREAQAAETQLLRLKAAELDRLAARAGARLAAQGVDTGSVAAVLQAARTAMETFKLPPPPAPPATNRPTATTEERPRRDPAMLFLGRFHLVVLHLPIGILFVASLLLLDSLLRRRPVSREIAGVLLQVGAVFAVVTAILGVLLADSGGYEGPDVERHRWFGVATAAFAGLAAALYRPSREKGSALFGPVFLAAMICLVAAGHYGGVLTHGSDYLTRYFRDWRAVFGRGGAGEPADSGMFAQTVRPILEKNCLACHGAENPKAGYRLDQRDIALKGGTSGKAAIAPGKPLESELVRRLLLPRSDDEAMPPVEKADLAPAEKMAILQWIAAGADWPAEKPAAVPAPMSGTAEDAEAAKEET